MLRKILLLTLLIALMTACAPQATPTSAALTFTDGLGREVKLNGPAQHIVSLAPSNTEILFAIGAGSQTVGRDEFSDYPEEAKALQSVGGSMGQYSTEAIVALKPDLVLAAEINAPELVKQLEDLGLTVYYLKNPTTLEEMYNNLGMVGQLTGHDVAELVDSLKARVAAVDEKVSTSTDKPVVFYEIDATDAAKPYTYGPGTFGDLLIQRAGGANLSTAAGITLCLVIRILEPHLRPSKPARVGKTSPQFRKIKFILLTIILSAALGRAWWMGSSSWRSYCIRICLSKQIHPEVGKQVSHLCVYLFTCLPKSCAAHHFFLLC